ncbi:Galactose-3-O-sulfotransferase [Branchiostoma belcheri]|nr:Galactose-3-O-sulfotransferase [Branchiostoma belcheri]
MPEMDKDYVEKYVTRLEREFMLVLILEYLDASLVLLKRYMCWDMVDILYKKIGSKSYDLKDVTATPKLRQQHENWSRADYILYRHFNTSLWDKINREGRDFWAEVKTFRDMHQRTYEFCHPGGKRSKNQSARLEFGQTPWSRRFHVDYQFCRLLRSGYAPMRHQAQVMHQSRLQQLEGSRGVPQNSGLVPYITSPLFYCCHCLMMDGDGFFGPYHHKGQLAGHLLKRLHGVLSCCGVQST